MKGIISFTVDSRETKQALDRYAIGRGFKNAGALSRAALFEYIRRRTPKEARLILEKGADNYDTK